MSNISKYNNSSLKRIIDLFISLLTLIVLLPVLLILIFLECLFKGLMVFQQERVGKDDSKFTIYKFRTMKINSENKQKKYKYLNESDGPVFKIRNDPRFTKIGKYLSRTGLDELPQFINVLKGDMSLVGPRPLPVYEFNKLNKKQKTRNLIKPGITSLWVVNGSHSLSFNEWMNLDKKYVEKANLLMDLEIILKTMLIPIKAFINFVFN